MTIPLSIVLPIYKPNCAYLRKMLISVSSQISSSDELLLHFDDAHPLDIDKMLGFSFSYRIKALPISAYGLGVNCAFRRLVAHATHDVVVFADQDDCWVEGRLDYIRKYFSSEHCKKVLALRPIVCDASMNPDFHANRLFRQRSVFPLLFFNSVVGNCIVARKSFFLKYTTPPYAITGMYDWHIGVIASALNVLQLSEQPGTYWRFHDASATFSRRSSLRLFQKVSWRMRLIWYAIVLNCMHICGST